MQQISKLLAEDIRKLAERLLARETDLYKALLIEAEGDDVVSMYITNYLESVKMTPSHHKLPPVEPIIKWMFYKGIPTDNLTVYEIRRSIVDDRLDTVKLLDGLFSAIDNMVMEQYMDKIFSDIVNKLDKYFNN